MELTFSRLSSTPEFRSHFRGLIYTQLICIILTVCMLFGIITIIENRLDSRIYAVASRIEKYYPEGSERIIPALLSPSERNEIVDGQELLSKYGYDKSLKGFANPLLAETSPFIITGFILLSAAVAFLNITTMLRHQKRIFNELLKMSNCINSILDGKNAFMKLNHDEGILDSLRSRFNQMVNMLQSTAERLADEKLNLKNIISDISHQLKTPLASLIMYIDLLESPDTDQISRIKFTNMCAGQLNRMEWLIKSLLKMARLETGTISFDKAPVDPVSIIRKSLRNLEHLTEERKIILNDQRGKSTQISGDPDWLAEALGNLIKNAFQHTPPDKGRIDITVSETPLFHRISIRDNGEGIPADQRPRIFDRFFKGASNVNMESVGIGLPLARTIIQAHGGDLRLSSESSNGAEFIITLPY